MGLAFAFFWSQAVLGEAVDDSLGHQVTDRALGHQAWIVLHVHEANQSAGAVFQAVTEGHMGHLPWQGIQQGGVMAAEEHPETALAGDVQQIWSSNCPARLGWMPLSTSSMTTRLSDGADSIAAAMARTRSVPSDNRGASHGGFTLPKVSVSLTITSARGVSMNVMSLSPASEGP